METQTYLSRDQISEIFASFNKNTKTSQSQQDFQVNQVVWVKNDKFDENDVENNTKPFYKAVILEDQRDKLSLKLCEGEECKENRFLFPFSHEKSLVMEYSLMAEQGLKDLIDIDELNHANILYNIYKRFLNDDIYSYVGQTLLAVNPFKSLSHKQSPNAVEDYMAIIRADENTFYDTMRSKEPHVYAISALSHKQMMVSKTRQGIVISGESGAGKTESAKLCMNFLTSLGSKNIDPSKPQMGDRILSTNPVLEAFGNAKTARNDNSSRFGKYVKLYFDQNDGRVVGAEIKNYLLEKSRVVGCTTVERNYHAFFFLLRGVEDDLAAQLGFLNSDGSRKQYTDFKFLVDCTDKNPVEDAHEYKLLIQAFNKLGFTPSEIEAIHKMTAATLWLGQVELVDTFDDGKDSKPVTIDKNGPIKEVARLLGINVDDLIVELVNKEKFEGVTARTPIKISSVKDSKDSLAKAIFDNLFNWLVNKMNLEILPDEKKSRNPAKEAQLAKDTKTIGLLDIFGFENFDLNQFEQLCINYVNEKLHNLYISSVFGAEKKEMEREGLQVQLVLPELRVLDVLKLMSNDSQKLGPGGIFNQVDDKCQGAMSDDLVKRTKDLNAVILKNHEGNKKVFAAKKLTTKFTIRHSAKEVIYDCKNFIERNSDYISKSLNQLILEKSDPQISKIYSMKTGFEVEVEEDSKNKRPKATLKTIWSKFSIQIQDLMGELGEPLLPKDFTSQENQTQQNVESLAQFKCDLHFIRCIKPSEKPKTKGAAITFKHAMTLQQISYMGVLESIKVKQENFPYRRKHEDFYRIYELLSSEYSNGRYDLMNPNQRSSKNWSDLCQKIIQKAFLPLGVEEYSSKFAVGRTKVMMMPETKTVLDKCKEIASFKYDDYSRIVKRAYMLQKAKKAIDHKMTQLVKIQRLMRKTYQKMQIKRAKMFNQLMLKAVVLYKTEKRRIYEEDAADVIRSVYRTYLFRSKLQNSIQSREFIVNGLMSLAKINRCRKLWICRRLVMKIVKKAYVKGKSRKEEEAVYRIQRILRGHMERNGKETLMLDAVKTKVLLKQHMGATMIQKRMKGLLVRRRINKFSLTLAKIQSYINMMWHRKYYFRLKSAVVRIQRVFRRFITKVRLIRIRLNDYLTEQVQILDKAQYLEYSQLFGHNINRTQAQNMGLLRTVSPYSTKKLNFFTRVIDLNMLVDLQSIYQLPWSTQWVRQVAENTLNTTPIMNVQIGTTHSLVVNSKGRLFAWGWNDNGQCAKPLHTSQITLDQQSIKHSQVTLDHIQQRKQEKNDLGGTKVKQIVATGDRCMVLLQDPNQVIVWGGNQEGVLGLGHEQDVSEPSPIQQLQGDIKIQQIAGGGDLNMACSEDGEAFVWPWILKGVKHISPVRLEVGRKIKIQNVTCGYNFGFLISLDGLVFSIGDNNKYGQLGLGHKHSVTSPTLIQYFKDLRERIEQVECGFKHAIARSSLGKVYTWGSGENGQLGLGDYQNQVSPCRVKIEFMNQQRVIQVAAGYSHNVIMFQCNKKLFWFGSCGSLNKQAIPLKIELGRYMPDLFGIQNQQEQDLSGPHSENSEGEEESDLRLSPQSNSQLRDFAIVKIQCSWSKTMTLTSVLVADMRAVNQETSHTKLMSTLQILNQRWGQKDVMPPFVESISSLFSANTMRKPNIEAIKFMKNEKKFKNQKNK